MEIAKKLLMLVLICIVVALASVVQKKEMQLEEMQQKSEKVDSLTAELEMEKELNQDLSYQLIRITYQHEDDDALMEEEMP